MMKSTVQDVMSTHVVAVRKNAPFKEMAARLRRQEQDKAAGTLTG
jgi:hypothetical protein